MKTSTHGDEGVNRRHFLIGGGLSLVALMLAAPLADAAVRERARSDPRFEFADRLSDLVLPTSDTPGASQAMVGVFLLMALDQQMGSLTPALLEQVRESLDAAAGGRFMAVSRERQGALLAALDRSAFSTDHTPDATGQAWKHLKLAIVAGYYTTEIGGSKELIYDPVPGPSRNIKLTPDFRSRSNDGFGGSL